MSLQTPSTELPGLRPLTPKEQVQRASAMACLSDEEKKPSCSKVILTSLFRWDKFLKLNSMANTLKLLLLALSLSTLTACASNEGAKHDDTMSGGALIGVNYTGEGIQRFSVDESGGGSIGRYSISGDYCCTMYPKVWTPELKVTVEWISGHYDKNDNFIVKEHKKTIPIEKYTELGRVYVVFLPKDEVRVYISKVGPKNKDFPTKLGFPQDPAATDKVKP